MESSSDKNLDLSDLDPAEIEANLTVRPNEPYRKNYLFGRLSPEAVKKLLEDSGMLKRLRDLGYVPDRILVESIDETDNRIFIFDPNQSRKQHLVHMRLKYMNYKLRNHPELPEFPMIFIDWVETCHLLSSRNKKLYPGQKFPGLGLYPAMAIFFQKLAEAVLARGAYNRPEYYHDAFLFHRDFLFYNPNHEGEFLALRRDFRKMKIRELSSALAEKKVCDEHQKVFPWKSAEMICFTDSDLQSIVFDSGWKKQVERIKQKKKFHLCSEN